MFASLWPAQPSLSSPDASSFTPSQLHSQSLTRILFISTNKIHTPQPTSDFDFNPFDQLDFHICKYAALRPVLCPPFQKYTFKNTLLKNTLLKNTLKNYTSKIHFQVQILRFILRQ